MALPPYRSYILPLPPLVPHLQVLRVDISALFPSPFSLARDPGISLRTKGGKVFDYQVNMMGFSTRELLVVTLAAFVCIVLVMACAECN